MHLKMVKLVQSLQTHSMSVSLSNHFRKQELTFKLVMKLNRSDGLKADVSCKPQ